MPTITEVTDRQVHYLRNPPVARHGVCEICWTFCTGSARCSRCAHEPVWATAVAPISMSVHGGQVHKLLWGYKHVSGRQGRLLLRDVVAMFWRFLWHHETCLAERCEVDAFAVVTTVPSGSARRDETHRLRAAIGEHVGVTRDRYERLLARSDVPVADRTVDPAKFDVQRALDGESVLLIDDTWTSGASVQSATAALVQAGAGRIGVVVAGRHIHEDYRDNADRLRELPRLFDWHTCVFH